MSTRNAVIPQLLNDPRTIEAPQQETYETTASQDTGNTDSEYRVVLYNDDFHSMEEVVLQLQKATGCDIETAINIMLEAHTHGRAICYQGTREECQRVARILREIRLQVEVDCD
ncbi:MAG TPA: ATP-dependent Clp protease adaptor ClpS [Abditibacteriaceae bacterium]|jgi:ATP-dependent Clp protease adaptor protein ClpS